MCLSFALGFLDGKEWTSIVHLTLNSHNHGFKAMLVTVESMPKRARWGIEAFQSRMKVSCRSLAAACFILCEHMLLSLGNVGCRGSLTLKSVPSMELKKISMPAMFSSHTIFFDFNAAIRLTHFQSSLPMQQWWQIVKREASIFAFFGHAQRKKCVKKRLLSPFSDFSFLVSCRSSGMCSFCIKSHHWSAKSKGADPQWAWNSRTFLSFDHRSDFK
jgi:hypothetical protein